MVATWTRYLAAALIAATLAAACEPPARDDTLDVSDVLTGDTTGFARATGPREFRFPRDHGPHPAFKTEWWYYTGNLESDSGRRFGFQLTFFRSALVPPAAVVPPREAETAVRSEWRSNEIYMAHFAVSDIEGGEFYAFERFARAAVGLAGARAAPFRVWVDDWQARATDPVAGGRDAVPAMQIEADAGGVAVTLRLEAAKPPVLQGVGGLSQKGQQPGNASYYYSLTRMDASGEVRVGGETYAVDGSAWMDREWSTSVLEADQVGWDWFALQLDDSTEIMVYQLRRRDGSQHPQSRGVVIDTDGAKRDLFPSEFSLEVLDHWTAPTGARYPSGWRLEIPSEAVVLNIVPTLKNQELDLSFRYWEGAVEVRGARVNTAVTGHGYIELTGYVTPQ